MQHPNLIVSGFEPFASFTENPSAQVALALSGRRLAGAIVHSVVLPVAFGADLHRLRPLLDELHPVLVLCLGLRAGAKRLEVERFAVNLRCGQDHGEVPIDAGGPAAYFATIDLAGLATCGPLVALHSYAGNYLCNHLFYQVLHLAATERRPYRAGFVHLPLAAELPLPQQVAAVGTLLEMLIDGNKSPVAVA